MTTEKLLKNHFSYSPGEILMITMLKKYMFYSKQEQPDLSAGIHLEKILMHIVGEENREMGFNHLEFYAWWNKICQEQDWKELEYGTLPC